MERATRIELAFSAWEAAALGDEGVTYLLVNDKNQQLPR